MGVCVTSLQFLKSDMSVNLCRIEAFMTQQFLHASQFCIVIEHYCGKGVPKYVWRAFLLSSNKGEVVPYDVINHTVGYRLPFVVPEQRAAIVRSRSFSSLCCW